MYNIVVVDRPKDWPAVKGVELVAARSYLREPRFALSDEDFKVINLCAKHTYQGIGYYVSLLASARGHRVTPPVGAPQDVKSRGFLESVDDELGSLKKRAFAEVKDDKASALSFFGESEDPAHGRLAKKLFRLLDIPIFRAHFAFDEEEEEWMLRRIEFLGAKSLTEEQKKQVLEYAARHFDRRSKARALKSYRYDLAILHDPEARDAPSNERALAKFERAAEKRGLYTERIVKADYGRILEFDALFIRETTSVNHHTYRFARKADAEGLVVIDDPESILRCSNKIYLAELLEKNDVPRLATEIISKDEVEHVSQDLEFPQVLKKPDGSFSVGSVKVKDRSEFLSAAEQLLEDSELIIAQPFRPTDYDWRIGVLDNEPWFACRYFMAKNHWQIIKRDKAGRNFEGDHETVPIERAPAAVVHAAVAATRLIGDGLYGVDVKEIDGKPYVIEVNDNPNLDAGVEDQILEDALYEKLVDVFLARITKKKGPGPEAA